MPQISISYPVWFIVPAVLVALGYAFLLYYKNRKNHFGRITTLFLGFLRFAGVLLLLLLLLSPFILTRTKEVVKPLLILAQDNSASVVMNKDSAWYKNQYPLKIKQLIRELSSSYNIDTLLFGAKTRPGGTAGFTDGISDYGELFSKIKRDYLGNAAGVVVVAGDGIYNSGFDPADAARDITAPVYTLLLGDTTTRRDLFIRDVRYNSLVYRDDVFPLEITVGARSLKGRKAKLTVRAFHKKAVDTTVFINSQRYTRTFKFEIKASEQGKQHLRIEVKPLAGERNDKNNKKDIFINVLNNRRHILILMNSPHPDIGAVRRALELLNNYVIDVKQLTANLKIKSRAYDLVILQGIPHSSPDLPVIRQIITQKTPLLFILDSRTDINRFNSLETGVSIKSALGKSEQAQAAFNRAFTLFHFDKKLSTSLEKLPPLSVPFGNWSVENGFQVLAFQKTGEIKTGYPLMVFGEKEGAKRGIIAGEGIWLWRLKEYFNDNNTEAVDKLISGAVQYLTAREDKRLFRIIAPDSKLTSQEVILKAELYNDAYEPVTDANIRLTLKDENGHSFDYNFLNNENGYSLNLGHLSPGLYRYNASVDRGKKTLYDKGEFIVTGLALESLNTKANAAIMYRLAREHNGKLFYANQTDSLIYRLTHNNKIPSKVKYTNRYTPFFHIPLILMLIIFLLSLEWFVRKYLGGY